MRRSILLVSGQGETLPMSDVMGVRRKCAPNTSAWVLDLGLRCGLLAETPDVNAHRPSRRSTPAAREAKPRSVRKLRPLFAAKRACRCRSPAIRDRELRVIYRGKIAR